MKLALDFDNVLAHTTQLWVEVCNHRSNGARLINVRDVDEWDFWKKIGLSHEEAFTIFDICWESWRQIPPLETELHQKTKMLRKLVDKMDIVTSVKEGHTVAIHSWLAKHNIEYDEVIFTQNKHLLDYDIFIDDSPDNAIKIYGENKQCLLYNQPWNRKSTDRIGSVVGIRRVYNLYHAIDVVRDLVARTREKGRFRSQTGFASSVMGKGKPSLQSN